MGRGGEGNEGGGAIVIVGEEGVQPRKREACSTKEERSEEETCGS